VTAGRSPPGCRRRVSTLAVARGILARHDWRVTSTRPDKELLEAWRQGDKDAGVALFQRYYDAVYRFFRNKLIDDSGDLVQQTFLACAEGRDRLRQAASFRSYLFGVACNTLRAHLRTKHRHAADDLDTVTAFDLSPGPGEIYARSREERLLLKALRRISVEQQVLLELRYWEELGSAEIAEILGLSDNTVRSKLVRAQANLKGVIERIASSPEELASTVDNLDAWAQRCRAALVGSQDDDPDDPDES
jgi:RNA polymerase sigma-70 factor (ECF subfamily)